MSQNMWRNIRIEHNVSINEVAKKIGCTRQMVSLMELGRRKKSLEYQIFILELRGFKEDIINANYLKEILNENKRIEKRTL
jgi:transcriptional regulator with XRE-family HTH domain